MTIQKISAIHSDGVERYAEYDDAHATLEDAQAALARAEPGIMDYRMRRVRALLKRYDHAT